MQTYLSDIIPKIQRFSRKLDELTLLTNQHWVVIDDITKNKYVYIFRGNNELLVSSDGKVEKGRWEYLGNNSLLIDIQENSYLYKHGFFDQNVLALKIDGKEEYAFLVNENKYDGELNSIDKVANFLNKNYLNPNIQKTIDIQYKIQNSGTNPIKKRGEMDKLMGYETGYGCTYFFIAGCLIIIFFVILVIVAPILDHYRIGYKTTSDFKFKQEKNPTYVTAKGIITWKEVIRNKNNTIISATLIVDGKCFGFTGSYEKLDKKEIGDYVEVSGENKRDGDCLVYAQIIK